MLFLEFHAYYIYCLGYVQVREGRNQTLAQCLKREFRLTINILRTTISEDMYEVTGVVSLVEHILTEDSSILLKYFELVPY